MIMRRTPLPSRSPQAARRRYPPPGGATINGPLAVNDDVSITGTATAADDVIGGGKSLKGHKHGNVQAGTSQTGAPI